MSSSLGKSIYASALLIVATALLSFGCGGFGTSVKSALTPGESSRADYEKFMKAGGLASNNTWGKVVISDVQFPEWGADGILKKVAFELSPVTDDEQGIVAEEFSGICANPWKMTKHGTEMWVWRGDGAQFSCAYMHIRTSDLGPGKDAVIIVPIGDAPSTFKSMGG